MAYRKTSANRSRAGREKPSRLRIVGGKYRGRQILYDGDPGTRPMKDRVREAVFNLVGPAAKGKQVLDLFAGTGAMALEAISRGACSAVTVERRFPAADTIRENAAALEVEPLVCVVSADAFSWWRSQPRLNDQPWLIFCCPPYALYSERADDMLSLIGELIDVAPADSLTVLEFDDRFDPTRLPEYESWDIRHYHPATIAVFERTLGG